MYAATVIASVALQLATVFQAFRLIRQTGGRVAWILISLAVTGMAARRGQTLLGVLQGAPTPNLIFELVGLATSACMLGGMLAIEPLFRAARRAEAEQRRLVGELTEAMSRIRTLSGIVPICATCKRIRDDTGYWQRVEAYVTAHSHAEFTHGICPECLERFSRDDMPDDQREE